MIQGKVTPVSTAGQKHVKAMGAHAYNLSSPAQALRCLYGKSLHYAIALSNQFHFKVSVSSLCGHRTARLSDEHGQFPRYFLGANGNQWLWDGFFADAHSCLCSSKKDHTPPALSSLPHPCKDICFCKFPDSPSYANFPAPLAKPWILHLFHFLPFQMGTTLHICYCDHCWTKKMRVDEDRDTLLCTAYRRDVLGLNQGLWTPTIFLKYQMHHCWLGLEAQESPYKPLLSIKNSQQGNKLIFIEYLLFVWPSVRCLILYIYLHLGLTNLVLL